MKPLPDLPDLRILPTDRLQPHEEVDVTRIAKLTDAIAKEGLLRNPPIVLELPESSRNFLVLDGANRMHALQELDIPFIVAQVVNSATDDIRVETWNHAVIEASSHDLIQRATEGTHVVAEPLDRPLNAAELRDQALLAAVSDPSGDQWKLRCTDTNLIEHVRCLHHLVELYANAVRVERTNAVSAEPLARLYPSLGYLVVFPAFRVSDIAAVAAEGRLVPSGLTRFIISPRALRLNYPLRSLSDTDELQVLEKRLRQRIDQLLRQRSIRYYAESTFVFDE